MAELIDRLSIRNKLYDADAITMRGVAMLNQEPTVEAVPVVHARWINKGFCVNDFCCSECYHVETSYKAINPLPNGGGCRSDENGNFYYPPEANYCPNCGAKMDGKEQNNGVD